MFQHTNVCGFRRWGNSVSWSIGFVCAPLC